LGISFFTFTQIAFLSDTYKGRCKEYNFIHYILFVTYFPHLIAGPIIHHKDMMPQFANLLRGKFSWYNVSLGASIFVLGLFKKVVVADYFVCFVQTLFDTASPPILFINAWFGILCYAVQLYFDFSGYSDMAIGLSTLFGIRMPINFNSPYQATSIIDFWRRWHISLSNFLREYLYIPLGGNRKGFIRKNMNLFLTMFLGGLWHGAGLTFILWGVIHGILLMLNNFLIWISNFIPSKLRRFFSVKETKKIITFLFVVLAWVPFRAPSLEISMNIWKGCFGMNGFIFPKIWAEKLGSYRGTIESMGWDIADVSPGFSLLSLCILFLSLLIVLYGPNVMQIFYSHRHALILSEKKDIDPPESLCWQWQPNKLWAMIIAIVFILGLWCRHATSEFLYFQF